jgi:hypothetical protein
MTKELSEIISVRFPKSTVDALKRRQAAIGIPVSESIRRAVAEALDEELEAEHVRFHGQKP